MTASENQIVVYQPNETVRLDVRLENETVWLTQEQIANLFGTKRPAITKHLANIYKSGELEREGTCSILEHMGNDGKQSFHDRFLIIDDKELYLIGASLKDLAKSALRSRNLTPVRLGASKKRRSRWGRRCGREED